MEKYLLDIADFLESRNVPCHLMRASYRHLRERGRRAYSASAKFLTLMLYVSKMDTKSYEHWQMVKYNRMDTEAEVRFANRMRDILTAIETMQCALDDEYVDVLELFKMYEKQLLPDCVRQGDALMRMVGIPPLLLPVTIRNGKVQFYKEKLTSLKDYEKADAFFVITPQMDMTIPKAQRDTKSFYVKLLPIAPVFEFLGVGGQFKFSQELGCGIMSPYAKSCKTEPALSALEKIMAGMQELEDEDFPNKEDLSIAVNASMAWINESSPVTPLESLFLAQEKIPVLRDRVLQTVE